MQISGRMARISRPKLSGFGSHEGVLTPSGLVVHLTQELGIRRVSLVEFAQGRPVHIKHEVPMERHREAMAQLDRLLFQNKAYDLILNNCEIFARTAVLEKPESPQILFMGLVALVAAVLYGSAHA